MALKLGHMAQIPPIVRTLLLVGLVPAAVVLIALAPWAIVPAPTTRLLVPGVGVPELSPALLPLAVIVAVFAAVLTQGRTRVVLVVALAGSAVLFALPLVRLPGTIRDFDARLAAVGITAPPDAVGRMRPAPFVWRDLQRGIDLGDARITRGVVVANADDETLTADVYAPPSGTGHPVVVQIYGGAWSRGDPDNDADFAQYLAARGHVVVAIDYRHAPRWTWPAQRDDVTTALAWVRDHVHEFGGDARRLVLLGRSAGAQLALVAAYTPGPLPVAGVVALYSPTNLAEGWRTPPSPDPLGVRGALEKYLGGTPDEQPDRYREASPVTHVSRDVPPTLLLNGGRDHAVEARFGRELDARLRAAGATSVYLELPWSEHAFDLPPRGLGLQISWYYAERFIAWALAGDMGTP